MDEVVSRRGMEIDIGWMVQSVHKIYLSGAGDA